MRRYEVSRRTLIQAGAATTGLTILGSAPSVVRPRTVSRSSSGTARSRSKTRTT